RSPVTVDNEIDGNALWNLSGSFSHAGNPWSWRSRSATSCSAHPGACRFRRAIAPNGQWVALFHADDAGVTKHLLAVLRVSSWSAAAERKRLSVPHREILRDAPAK